LTVGNMIRAAVIVMSAVLATPALAEDRGFSVTDFDRIEVDGAYDVSVETGRSPSARATGSGAGLDRLLVEVRGRTLRIRMSRVNGMSWRSDPIVPPKVKIGVPGLREASLRGSGSLSISKMRSATIRLFQVGSGSLSVATIEADRLFANQAGSGMMALRGKALIGALSVEGSGQLAAEGLSVTDLTLTSRSAGATKVSAVRTANVTSNASGEVTVSGRAACTVTATGSGEVRCGRDR
jgi:Putative auto-transporter adhesin, head GIN domain